MLTDLDEKNESRLARDVLTRQVLRDSKGSLWVEELRGTSTYTWSLDLAKERHKELTVSLAQVPSGIRATMEVVQLVFPRAGFSYYWNAERVYTLAGMTAYKGHKSKWFYNMFEAMAKTLKDIGMPGDGVLKSRYSGLAEEGGAASDDAGFCRFRV